MDWTGMKKRGEEIRSEFENSTWLVAHHILPCGSFPTTEHRKESIQSKTIWSARFSKLYRYLNYKNCWLGPVKNHPVEIFDGLASPPLTFFFPSSLFSFAFLVGRVAMRIFFFFE